MKRWMCAALCGAMALIASCGDNVDSNTGALPDAGAPAADAAPTSGPCTAVVAVNNIFGSESDIGATVLFHAPDGSLLGTELTDVKGEATFDTCVLDTTVTVIVEDSADYYELFTYTHVQPGDTVYFGNPSGFEGESRPNATLNVSSSEDISVAPGSDDWDANIGCDGGDQDIGTPVVFSDIDRSCLGSDENVDVLGTLVDGSEVVGYAFVKDVPVTPGTSETLAETLISLPAWTAGNVDNALVVSNLPPSTDSFFIAGQQLVDGVDFSGESDEGSTPAPIESITFAGLPEGFGERSRGAAFMGEDVGIGYGERSLFVDRDFQRTIAVDASEAMPLIRSVVVTGLAAGTPRIEWIADGDLAGEMAAFGIYFEGESVSAGWVVVTPSANAGVVGLPTIPEPYGSRVRDALLLGSVFPFFGTVIDTSWMSYRDHITNPDFEPTQVGNTENPRVTEPPATGTNTLRQTAYWAL